MRKFTPRHPCFYRILQDVRIAAEQNYLHVVTECELAYAGKQAIRPDNLVTLSDITRAIFETEQQAIPSLLRRITESMQNKLGFYKSPESQNVSPVGRMIVNAAPGADFQKTLKVWRRVFAMLTKTSQLPFKLVAMPLAEFRELPDWSPEAQDSRWVEISSLEREIKSEMLIQNKQEILLPVPKAFLQQSAHDIRLTLEALWFWFQEQAHTQQPQYPLPDHEFFEIMQIIYAASHNQDASPLEQAGMPWASLYLLTRYLEMHPSLRKKLGQAINRGGNAMRWNPTTILHRMQVIIDVLLGYHGWRSSGPLTAYSSTSSWSANEPHSFSVVVGITKKEILMLPTETIVPGTDQEEQVERAVAWVLWSLIAYAPYLGCVLGK